MEATLSPEEERKQTIINANFNYLFPGESAELKTNGQKARRALAYLRGNDRLVQRIQERIGPENIQKLTNLFLNPSNLNDLSLGFTGLRMEVYFEG